MSEIPEPCLRHSREGWCFNLLLNQVWHRFCWICEAWHIPPASDQATTCKDGEHYFTGDPLACRDCGEPHVNDSDEHYP